MKQHSRKARRPSIGIGRWFLRAVHACRPMARFPFVFALALASLIAAPAHAHKASDAYLQLSRTGDAIELRWDISLRDLDAVLDLDSNADRQLSWGELKTHLPAIRAYALPRLQLQGGQCPLAEDRPPTLERRIDGTYLVLQLQARCGGLGNTLALDYRLFGDVDPTHRGLLRIDGGSGALPAIESLDPAAGPVDVALPGSAGSATAQMPASAGWGFFRDGVHHILIGYDHILFLICLVLPSVLRRKPGGGWQPVENWHQAVWPMVGVVTMFTIGHSITLALAGLRIVTLSPRIVEPAIALTIILAAVDNIRPLLRGKRRVFTFIFGLIHGFGFASVLAGLDLPTGGFVAALLEFNLGVEAGQLIIVSIALAALLVARWWRAYPRVLLRGGSGFAISIAALWLIERVFDLKILPV